MPAELALAESLLPFAAVNGDGAWSPPVDVRDGVLEIAVPKGLSSRPAIRKEVIMRATSRLSRGGVTWVQRVAPGSHGRANATKRGDPRGLRIRIARRNPHGSAPSSRSW